MFKNFLAKLILLIFLLPSSCLSAPLKATELMRDRRNIHDMASLDLIEIATAKSDLWALTKVSPAVIQQKEDWTVKPDGYSLEIPLTAIIRIKKVLSGETSDTTFNVSWKQQGVINHGKILYIDMINPFSYLYEEAFVPVFLTGGIVVSELHMEREDRAKLNPCFLLPNEWESYILPALDNLKNKKSNEQLNTSEYIKLLGNSNPFLSILAFRNLLSTGEYPQVLSSALISEKDAQKQAIFIFLTLQSSSLVRQQLVDNLNRTIESAVKPEDIQGIALGLFSARANLKDDYIGTYTYPDGTVNKPSNFEQAVSQLNQAMSRKQGQWEALGYDVSYLKLTRHFWKPGIKQ